MHENRFSFIVDASPEEIWDLMHARPSSSDEGEVEYGEFGPIRRLIEIGDVRVEVVHEGDEHGDGLVRHCYFSVPWWLLSGGVAQSWEYVTEVVPYRSAKFYAVGKPLWSRAEGEHHLEDLGDGRTRLHFIERYFVFNPIVRFFLEKAVHTFISRDNNEMIERNLTEGIKWARESRKGA